MSDGQGENDRDGEKDGSSKQRRPKYITRACQDCQRRKVKCSGTEPCAHCSARGLECVYVPKPSREQRKERAQQAESPGSGHMDSDLTEIRNSRGATMNASTLSLQERIFRLQEEVKRVSERNAAIQQIEQNERSRKSTGNKSRSFIGSSTFPLCVPDLPQSIGDETDTFILNMTGSRNLSLSSQLAALRELLMSRNTSPMSTLQLRASDEKLFPTELPRPPRLRYLLDVYFRDMDSYFPFLDQLDTETRIYEALQSLGYTEYNLIIDVDAQHHSIIGLLCNMLCMGECLDPTPQDGEDSRPGWPMFIRGKKLLQNCLSLQRFDLDTVRYQTLCALYLIHSELLQPAAQAISTAIQISMTIRLNDQSAWGGCEPSAVLARQKLWWTIYFLDRRISQRNGSPYIIRDTEVAVEEFKGSMTTCNPSQQDSDAESATGRDQCGSFPNEGAIQSYLQVLLTFGRLWGQIWDTFFAASAPTRADWREVEIADTKIIHVQRQIPVDLTWDTDQVPKYIASGETEPQLRRRLAIFIRLNLLRMIVRQNPLLSSKVNNSSHDICALLARYTVEGILAFVHVCPGIRPSGYFMCTALVECIYHLVNILKQSNPQLDREATAHAFKDAYQLVLQFAKTLNSGRHAIRALTVALGSQGDCAKLAETDGDSTSMDLMKLISTLSDGLASSQNQDSHDGSAQEAPPMSSAGMNRNSKPAPISQHKGTSMAGIVPTTSLHQLSPKNMTRTKQNHHQNSDQATAVKTANLTATSTVEQRHQKRAMDSDSMQSGNNSGFMQELASVYGDMEFDV